MEILAYIWIFSIVTHILVYNILANLGDELSKQMIESQEFMKGRILYVILFPPFALYELFFFVWSFVLVKYYEHTARRHSQKANDLLQSVLDEMNE